MTILEAAKGGNLTAVIQEAADAEKVPPQVLMERVAEGSAVVCRNKVHSGLRPLAIGKGLRTKINANIGSSRDHADLDLEVEKARVALSAGADTIMDLSTGGDIDAIRRAVMKAAPIPVGTVPIYQAIVESVEKRETAMVNMTADDVFEVIERHVEDGVDFLTVHCGVTFESMVRMEREGRVTDVVSRGGSFTLEWMRYNEKENPLYEHYDRLLEIAGKYDVVLSLGDGFRPGCLADATDRGQVQELIVLGELAQRAQDAGVQVMIEGPGHVPLHQIEANVLLEKTLCHGAPFYVLGPIVTDLAPGYDHITGAIGGAIAAAAGTDFLCYVTPSEHLRLPTTEDVRVGVIASRIAAHAGDIAKGVSGAAERDHEMAKRRKDLDWEGQISLAIDPERARAMRSSSLPSDSDVCTMCADYCAIKIGAKDRNPSGNHEKRT